MSDMSGIYTYASNGPIEPFWHRDRINRLFLLPLDKTVLTRIGGLSAAFVASFALLLFGGFGLLLLVFALLAILVTGTRYGFKIDRHVVTFRTGLPAARARSAETR